MTVKIPIAANNQTKRQKIKRKSKLNLKKRRCKQNSKINAIKRTKRNVKEKKMKKVMTVNKEA
jgi:hypothetical protein